MKRYSGFTLLALVACMAMVAARSHSGIAQPATSNRLRISVVQQRLKLRVLQEEAGQWENLAEAYKSEEGSGSSASSGGSSSNSAAPEGSAAPAGAPTDGAPSAAGDAAPTGSAPSPTDHSSGSGAGQSNNGDSVAPAAANPAPTDQGSNSNPAPEGDGSGAYWDNWAEDEQQSREGSKQAAASENERNNPASKEESEKAGAAPVSGDGDEPTANSPAPSTPVGTPDSSTRGDSKDNTAGAATTADEEQEAALWEELGDEGATNGAGTAPASAAATPAPAADASAPAPAADDAPVPTSDAVAEPAANATSAPSADATREPVADSPSPERSLISEPGEDSVSVSVSSIVVDASAQAERSIMDDAAAVSSSFGADSGDDGLGDDGASGADVASARPAAAATAAATSQAVATVGLPAATTATAGLPLAAVATAPLAAVTPAAQADTAWASVALGAPLLSASTVPNATTNATGAVNGSTVAPVDTSVSSTGALSAPPSKGAFALDGAWGAFTTAVKAATKAATATVMGLEAGLDSWTSAAAKPQTVVPHVDPEQIEGTKAVAIAWADGSSNITVISVNGTNVSDWREGAKTAALTADAASVDLVDALLDNATTNATVNGTAASIAVLNATIPGTLGQNATYLAAAQLGTSVLGNAAAQATDTVAGGDFDDDEPEPASAVPWGRRRRRRRRKDPSAVAAASVPLTKDEALKHALSALRKKPDPEAERQLGQGDQWVPTAKPNALKRAPGAAPFSFLQGAEIVSPSQGDKSRGWLKSARASAPSEPRPWAVTAFLKAHQRTIILCIIVAAVASVLMTANRPGGAPGAMPFEGIKYSNLPQGVGAQLNWAGAGARGLWQGAMGAAGGAPGAQVPPPADSHQPTAAADPAAGEVDTWNGSWSEEAEAGRRPQHPAAPRSARQGQGRSRRHSRG